MPIQNFPVKLYYISSINTTVLEDTKHSIQRSVKEAHFQDIAFHHIDT